MTGSPVEEWPTKGPSGIRTYLYVAVLGVLSWAVVGLAVLAIV